MFPTVGLAFNSSTVERLDRFKYFNIHSSPSSPVEWPQSDARQFQSTYAAHLGRAFDVSYTMSQSSADPSRDGLVNITALKQYCAGLKQLGAWNESAVDMIISSKVTCTCFGLISSSSSHQLQVEAYYPTTGSGFIPASHAASADFWIQYLRYCPLPSLQVGSPLLIQDDRFPCYC